MDFLQHHLTAMNYLRESRGLGQLKHKNRNLNSNARKKAVTTYHMKLRPEVISILLNQLFKCENTNYGRSWFHWVKPTESSQKNLNQIMYLIIFRMQLVLITVKSKIY